MAGQSTWANAGTATNAFVVNPRLSKSIYYKSTWKSIVGKINAGRTVKTVEIEHSGGKTIDVANSSIVWEKEFGKASNGGNEIRYTMREENTGMARYGASQPAAGDYARYKHTQGWINEVKSPKYPIVDSESAEKIMEVIPDLVKVEKDNIAVWRAKEVDLEWFRACLGGASRNLLLATDGGLGITLFGGSAGAQRSCYNFMVANASALVTPSAVLATHEQACHDAIAGLSDNDDYQFDYDEHKKISYWIGKLNFQPATVGKAEYRAIAFTDPRNIERMTATGGTLSDLFKYAWERGSKNPALYRMQAMELDDILYMPLQLLEFFRPAVNGGGTGIDYGCGYTSDPRSSAYSNSSNLCLTIVCGAGAMLRGMEKRVWVTSDVDAHTGAADYCVHYRDGFVRREWFTKDSRTVMENDSMLVHVSYDPGVGIAYAA
jgi:hypothetical protein